MSRFPAVRPLVLRPPAKRTGNGYYHDHHEGSMTADVVYDDPREPVIEATGVLDARGVMLCRVIIPIKQRLGFATGPRWGEDVQDCVADILPEDMIRVSNAGLGLESIDESEMEFDDE